MALLLALAANSCKPEDDLEGIFVGKTWKMSNICTADDKPTLSTSEVNAINASSGYTISFTETTFTATATNRQIEGTWEANDKGNTFALTVTSSQGSETSSLGNTFIDMLVSSRYYEGDYFSLKLYDDNKSEYLLLRSY